MHRILDWYLEKDILEDTQQSLDVLRIGQVYCSVILLY